MLSSHLLLVALASANALAPSVLGSALTPSVQLRRPPACLSRLRCCSVDGAGDNSESFSAYDISSELAKYNKPGLRIRQSGPVRRVLDTTTGVIDGLGGMASRFGRRLSRVPPFVLFLAVGFALQSPALSNMLGDYKSPIMFRKLVRLMLAVTIIRKLMMRRTGR